MRTATCRQRRPLGTPDANRTFDRTPPLRRYDRPLRFTELRRHIEGVTQKSLTQALRNLERDGLISRTVYPTIPPRVEYALTDLGVAAGALTTAIADWSLANATRVLESRAAYDDRLADQS
ncbi:winged helix-turn-helix transcriptional regulator [Nocardia sp. NPDC006044]|uniref:winged helix-turn-helix transcriptional regulator n=1 Tax=Nocardia sp. NPDC006044 TaxID=3364306 RepID=UPI00367C263F